MRNVKKAKERREYPGLTVRRDGASIVVHIPMRFRRRNGVRMILTPEGMQADPDRQVASPLVAALARAWRWQEQLESGEFASIQDLADAAGVSRVYAGRMMRLTALAPDLVEAILAGNEPDGLSIEKLHDGIPVAWDGQRKRWLGGA